ncbi:hypothetical protein DMUE_1375 [Dictyocoela muelleri]|nr:hypothetical protein DMUE_1375 [Dictyocoela muelleri]
MPIHKILSNRLLFNLANLDYKHLNYSQIIKKTTIYDALCFIKAACDSVTCETIVKCYEKSLRHSMIDDLLGLKININFNEIGIPCFAPQEDFNNDFKFIIENLNDTEEMKKYPTIFVKNITQ